MRRGISLQVAKAFHDLPCFCRKTNALAVRKPSKAEGHYTLLQPGVIFNSAQITTQIIHVSSQQCDRVTTLIFEKMSIWTMHQNLALLTQMFHGKHI